MDQQVDQQLDQQLRQRWTDLYPAILDRFTTVSKADIEAAVNASDLVTRIADKSQFTERYVETQLHALVTTGSGSSQGQQRSFASVGTPIGQNR